jgi:hypothetical protein
MINSDLEKRNTLKMFTVSGGAKNGVHEGIYR